MKKLNSNNESVPLLLATGFCLIGFLLLLPQTFAARQTEQPNVDPRLELFVEEELSHWAFQPLTNPVLPELSDDQWSRNGIDKFVLQTLRTNDLSPAPEANRAKLLRRVYYDLIGMPPTAEQINAFIFDNRPDAYERVVDQLLESSHYGERWAQHWLDLVRYADSDGYRQDKLRQHAWRFRDYVIKSFNEDKPFNQFVLEQLAGDEMFPDNPDAVCATGFLRQGIYEYNQSDVKSQWDSILNEITGVTGEVFLGMSIGCAQCHDHKFDPILQKDFFRLRAFFEAVSFQDEVPLATPAEKQEFENQRQQWLEQTKTIRDEIQSINQEASFKKRAYAISRLPKDIQQLVHSERSELNPRDQLLAELAARQVYAMGRARVKGELKVRLDKLNKELAEYDAIKPKPLTQADTITDVGSVAPETYIPDELDGEIIQPGFPSIVDPSDAYIKQSSENTKTTGRRTVLAEWIASPKNPLSTRVIVNRMWQYHFGAGIVETPSDFGNLGEPPSHPELLDWLVSDFIANDWKFKSLHRLIVTSATYRQSVASPQYHVASKIDPENRLLWRANGRRLSAEEIRDTIHVASGEIDKKTNGPATSFADPRRSIYGKKLRNTKARMLAVFDSPYCVISTAERPHTTTALQALFMMNGKWMRKKAELVVKRVEKYPENEQMDILFQLIYSRRPTLVERSLAEEFLQTSTNSSTSVSGELKFDRQESLSDLSHAMLNSNQFLYLE